VFRLDPRNGRIAAEVPQTIQVAGMAVGAGSLWVSDAINDVVFRIDPRYNLPVASIPVANGPRHLAVGEQAVWVTGEFPRSGVWRIDPRTNRAVAHIPVPSRANRVAVGDGSVWVTSKTPGHAGPGSVSRIDPKANKVVATIDLGFSPEGVACRQRPRLDRHRPDVELRPGSALSGCMLRSCRRYTGFGNA
jgi:virginiamycin B lyase